jgi:hypothetical protein
MGSRSKYAFMDVRFMLPPRSSRRAVVRAKHAVPYSKQHGIVVATRSVGGNVASNGSLNGMVASGRAIGKTGSDDKGFEPIGAATVDQEERGSPYKDI